MLRRKLSALGAVGLSLCLLLGGCTGDDQSAAVSGGSQGTESQSSTEAVGQQSAYQQMEAVNIQEQNIIDDKYRNYYEIFPYSFCDSNDDGIGDLNGITGQLDYLADLGINGIWLTPIYPSTTYHKYDVINYCEIDTRFGTMEDFDSLMAECEAKGIDVILDLVVNHTSSHHEWFTQAVEYIKTLGEGEQPDAGVCPYVEYYNFFQEFASGYTKIEGTEWYYESRFWSEMPDLNLDSEAVRQEIDAIVQFWLDKGVAGFRLDATTSYYTGDDASNIAFMAWLNECVKGKKPDAYLVGECWANKQTYSSYYASGIDSFFNFDFADQGGTINKVLVNGSAKSFGTAIIAADEESRAKNPDYIDAAFTSNHDTGRSGGYYAGDYATAQIKMAQGMAMMMGGNYFLYYGDEIGMKGSGDDENKRCPMQWSNADAEGMCDSIATKQVDMIYGSLEEQMADENSIYYFVKEGLKLRNTYPEIARGETTMLEELSDDDVVVLQKTYEDSQLLIVMNLSDTEKVIDLTSVALNQKEAGDLTVAGMLITGETSVLWEGGKVTLPPFSVELFR